MRLLLSYKRGERGEEIGIDYFTLIYFSSLVTTKVGSHPIEEFSQLQLPSSAGI